MSSIILIIDDDAAMNAIISGILQAEGYVIYTATEFTKGLNDVKSIRPDLIILDLYIAGKDGGDLLKAIRQIPRAEKTPVLMLSGETRVGAIKRVMTAGATHYMVKPFAPADLLAKVRKLLAAEKNDG